MKILLRILVGALALLLITYFLPESMHISGWYAACIASLLIGVASITIRPLLLLLSLPLTFITFGLFTVIIDALLLVFVDKLIDGFTVYGFGWAIIVAVLLAAIKYIANKFI